MTIITTRPEEILAYHAEIAERYSRANHILSLYMRNFMQDCVRRGGRVAASTFYPVLHEGIYDGVITERMGHSMCAVIGQDLADAITYEVTQEMTGIMQAVYDKSITERNQTLERDELPCESGFAWFDDGWQILDRNGDPFIIRAVSWKHSEVYVTREDRFASTGVHGVVRIVLWVHVTDDPPELMGKMDVPEIGKVQIIHAGILPYNMHLEGIDQEHGESFLNMVKLLWMFLGMELVTTKPRKIKNHYRKHALRSLKHGEVHTIILRRIRNITEPPEGHAHVDWSCRWVVQGHYRHLTNPQAVEGMHVHHAVALTSGAGKICAVCGGKLTWVRPYLKGPDGLPLKISHTLMKLAR